MTLNRLTKSDYPFIADGNIDKSIPVMYGKCASIEITCINENLSPDSDAVKAVYKLPEGTSNIGTAYIKVDDIWKRATGTIADYALGTLTISNGREENGTTRTVKLVNCYGYMFNSHCYPRQALEHFFSKYGNIEYTDSNFSKTEWKNELDNADLKKDIGFVIDSDVETWDQVFNISQKCSRFFRVDYTAQGKITARVKDFGRSSSRSIASCDIVNSMTIPIASDRTGVYSSVMCKYYQNYVDDKFLSVVNNTYEKEVKQKYRKTQVYEIESYLTNQVDAESRAYEDATRLSDVPMVATVDIVGNLDIRLYDVITVALMPDNLDSTARAYAGNRDCLVVGVSPDLVNEINTVSCLIIPDRVPLNSQSAVMSGSYSTIERAQSKLEQIADVAYNATVTFNSLASAQVSGKTGDYFTEGGITYRANAYGANITLANSTRITTIRWADVSDLNALNAIVGMINYDTVYQTDVMQWYYYLDGWITDGSAPLNGQYQNSIFAKNTSPTSPPALNQVDAPGGWYDAPPTLDTDEYLWFSRSTWRDVVRLSNWSTPVRISGTLADLLTQYSIDGINWTTSTTDAIYMRISPDGGLTWGDTVRIKGEQGDQGPAGSGVYVLITDPLETTASYQNGQLGTFAGYNYIWTATSETTGYWTIQARTPISSSGLQAYMSLDENTNDTYGNFACIDNSGNGNNGYAKNAIITTGFRGNALSITARNQYINL